jgi:hypothetical protein
MNEPASAGSPSRDRGSTRFRWALYFFYCCLGLAGAARLVEGKESILGFWSSVAFVVGGVVSALALLYEWVTKKRL